MVLYPTRRAIVLVMAGAPIAVGVALAAPGLWGIAAAWVLMAAGLMVADVLLAPSPSRLGLHLSVPSAMGLGAAQPARIGAAFSGPQPGRIELAVDVEARLRADPVRQWLRLGPDGAGTTISLTPVRRGEGRVEALWARWQGPLGLVWLQRRQATDAAIAISPDIEQVKTLANRLFSRDTLFGLKAQRERGDGGDFHALRDFQTGMDPRTIDWKQSGRHHKLVAREFHTERNHHIVLAIDSGRLMSAPAPEGSRLDQAIKAALFLAFVGLKLGDRAGLFVFAAQPKIASGMVSGPRAFPQLQRLAAAIDYSAEETNFTLGLATLSSRLDRRALVVVFTDFADPTSAELMIENLARLMRTHLVLFVAFRDAELERITGAEPKEPEDVSRAVMAGVLMRHRESVIARLRRQGARIVDAGADDLGVALVDSYLDVTRRGLL